ncbi:SDR family oxidoreductase [Arsenicicoccus sp. oral taxon 190]|uniref:SDR family oxidoreductase n=1 Tax=Arsenicicoccus sp. oral taxon 190 TaxID=1658671 RepID=UPI00067A2E7D|nr:SDR family oxidoreductase [Arsenicicoccus sp. oral taxon 190]AKT50998.1 oxidoreductase [Arsenicicoccus sp. oral taxon 190]
MSQDADQTTTDQLTLQDPTKRYPSIEPPATPLPGTGLDSEMTPKADLGEKSYRGTGRLTGRKALITGGDSGIGAATAIAYAREGADVVITYLPEEESDAQRVAEVITAEGRTVKTIAGDLRDKAFAATLVEQTVSALGGLDILVNNGGKQVATDGIEAISDEQLEATYDINILAMFRLVRAALPHLQPGSAIINTTSIQAYQPSPTLIDYASTKAAINNFTKGLAEELAPKGIRVNAVAPGPIWTPLQPSGGQQPQDLPEFGKSTGLGRAGQPTELAPAYVFLASPESSYVVGETLNVNGGMPTP